MTRMKALWIDDEPDETFVMLAEKHGILLEVAITHEEGVEKFEKSPSSFFAVILDVKGFVSETDEVATDSGFNRSLRFFDKLPPEEKVEIMAYTGQPDYHDSADFMRRTEADYEIKVFTKPNERHALFESLKNAQERSPSFKITSLYPRIFSALEDLNLSGSAQKDLMDVLKSIHFPENKIRYQHYYVCLRQVFEQLMHKAKDRGILHPECIPNGKANSRNSLTFLSGEWTSMGKIFAQNKGPVFPMVLQRNLHNVLDVLNAGVHWDKPDENDRSLQLPEYQESINTPHLLFACTFFVMDLILWFHQAASQQKSNQSKPGNWKEIRLPFEEILIDKGKELGCGKFSLPMKAKSTCRVGSNIVIKRGTLNNRYPHDSSFPFFAIDYKPA